MSVHGFFIIGCRFTYQFVMGSTPIAGKDFEISVRLFIESIFFKQPEYFPGCFQGFHVARGPIIFSQSINKKRLGVNLFPGIGWFSI